MLVVGGGAVGCAVAWSLAREGLRVLLLERDAIAAQASGAAAGMLIPSGEAGVSGPLLRFGLSSLALFPEIAAELRQEAGVDPQYESSGVLYVAACDAEVAALQQRARALPELGLEWLDAAAVRDAEPQLAPDLCGALWSPREGHVRSALLARGFAAAAERLGARVETGVAVTGLVCEGRRVLGVRSSAGDRHAGQVVVCTGAWAPACTGWLGVELALPIEPERGQIVCVDAPRPALRAVVVHESGYLVPRRDASVVIGATRERVGFDCRVTAQGVSGLLAVGARLAPALADATFRSAWAGLRPAAPDALPLIGPLPGVEGLLLAAGHHRNGVLLSPISGRLIADLVLGKELPADAAALRPERFDPRAIPHA